MYLKCYGRTSHADYVTGDDCVIYAQYRRVLNSVDASSIEYLEIDHDVVLNITCSPFSIFLSVFN